MHLKWEVWGVVGVIALQSLFIWLVYRLASETFRIYLTQLR
jgi:hypothetical protein